MYCSSLPPSLYYNRELFSDRGTQIFGGQIADRLDAGVLIRYAESGDAWSEEFGEKYCIRI